MSHRSSDMVWRLIIKLSSVSIFILFLEHAEGTEPSVTVEKGGTAILECPGFAPNLEDSREVNATFIWYRARKADRDATNNQVAAYSKSDNVQKLVSGLEGRATINGTSGALEISGTRLTDDHYYTCEFQDTDKGTITKETHLIITDQPSGTPSIKPLEDSTTSSSIKLTCDTNGVDGRITWFQWQFANGIVIQNSSRSTLEHKTSSDGKFIFVCICGNSFGNTSKSQPLEIEIYNIYRPGLAVTPNWTVFILGTSLAALACVTIILAICLIHSCCRNTKETPPEQTPSDQPTAPHPHRYYEMELQRPKAAAAPPAPSTGKNFFEISQDQFF